MNRRLRGTVGNALAWGAAWYVVSLVIFTILRIMGVVPSTAPWIEVARGCMKFAVMGTIAGGAFSTFIGVRYRGRSLSQISWWRFGIGGAIVTGLFVPGFISLMRLLSGEAMLPLRSLLTNASVGFIFGGIAAAGSMKIAQLASGMLPKGAEEDGLLEGGDRARIGGMAGVKALVGSAVRHTEAD